jgi:hypothetical protein
MFYIKRRDFKKLKKKVFKKFSLKNWPQSKTDEGAVFNSRGPGPVQ